MSRLKRYAHSLFSSYIQLGANIVFTLASVPIALHYLSKEEFGLWALTTQLAGYLNLIDAGMSGSVSRILVDHKDHPNEGSYGEVIQTAFLVNLVQGIIVLAIGIGLAFVMGTLMGVPSNLQLEFRWLLFWQSILLCIGFVFRLSWLILGAHQRSDVVNYAQAFIFFLQLAALWAFFHFGYGVLSMIWATGLAQVLGLAASIVSCWLLGFWPRSGCWGRPTWPRFCELFAFGRDMFLYQIGAQLVNASQTILITRLLGLEFSAVWSVCTRTYTLLTQVVCKIFDISCSPLAEMIVRGEKRRLLERFKSLVVLTTSLSVVGGVLFAYGNQPFVHWWTHGRITWLALNNVLLAAYLALAMLARSHMGLAGLTKEFRFLRYVYLLEGVFFVLISSLVLRGGGMTAMIYVALAASLAFSVPYGIWRSAEYFGLRWKTVALEWIRPSLMLALWLVPFVALFWWFTRSFSPWLQLAAAAGVLAPVSGLLFLRYGLDSGLAQEVKRRLPQKLLPRWLIVAGD